MGQSAISIRTQHPGPILSFEPNPELEFYLSYIKSLIPGFEYQIAGLGDQEQTNPFFVPTVNGIPFYQEGTNNKEILNESVTKRRFKEVTGRSDFKIKEIQVKIKTLDSLYLKPDVIKLDTQATELNILKGGLETLKAQEPILLIEAGSELQKITDYLKPIGYEPFQYKKNMLIPFPFTPRLNTFFMTSKWVSHPLIKKLLN
jgi:FkbM family methyltransferase